MKRYFSAQFVVVCPIPSDKNGLLTISRKLWHHKINFRTNGVFGLVENGTKLAIGQKEKTFYSAQIRIRGHTGNREKDEGGLPVEVVPTRTCLLILLRLIPQ